MKGPGSERQDSQIGPVVVSMLFLAAGVYNGKEAWDRYQSWQGLDQIKVIETLSVRGSSGARFGSSYEIQLEDRIVECSGADFGAKSNREKMVFDPGDPRRCREKAALGTLSSYEQMMLGLWGFWIVAAGIMVLSNLGRMFKSHKSVTPYTQGRQKR